MRSAVGEWSELGCRAWWSVWGKATRDDQRRIDGWLPLAQHLADAAGVAGLLVDHWVPPAVLRVVGGDLPSGVDDARALIAFVVQVPTLTSVLHRHGLPMSSGWRATRGAGRSRTP